MIEDVIDSYVPTIKNMGQVGFFDSTQKHVTITLSSTAKFFMIFDASASPNPLIFIRLLDDWSLDSETYNNLTITLSGNIITLDYDRSTRTHYYYLWL